MNNSKIQKTMPNLSHFLETYVKKEKGIIHGLIEINMGSINKYQIVAETGHLKLDRVGYSSLTFPVAYGSIPQTLDHDGDMLDFIIANVTEPLIPGSYAELRVIGIMKFEDGGEIDDKIITVLADDKRMNHISTFTELGEHWCKETEHYFEYYKHLKKPGTCKVLGFFDTTEAIKVIDECIEKYAKEYGPLLTD